ncbi:MAG: GguC protein, partial [Longimicrobiales bacterium]
MKGADRLVQLIDSQGKRLLCLVEEPLLHVLRSYSSVYELATAALIAREHLADIARANVGPDTIAYDAVCDGSIGLRFLPAIDHPTEPARCLVSGTGLTHRRSVDTRQAMHAADATVTDSMRMYDLGVAAGRPASGSVGVSPEWFYKGSGAVLRGHGQPLVVPAYAEDGGEEPEIACAYVIDGAGVPRRIGMAIGNEFADHKLERRNYLYLAASKLRMCALGPELVLDPDFMDVRGEVAIERDGAVFWSRAVRGGDAAMCHSLGNIEHHHFK